MRTWGRVDSVGVWLPRNCFAGAHLRLPTSKQGGQCALLIRCAGCGACSRSLASLRQPLRAPSVPHSLLSSQLRLQGPRLRVTTLSPHCGQARCPLFRRLSTSLIPSPVPHGTLWILSYSLFSRTEPPLPFFRFYGKGPSLQPPPALPSCRDAAPALPPETANLELAIILTAVCRAHPAGRQGTSHISL